MKGVMADRAGEDEDTGVAFRDVKQLTLGILGVLARHAWRLLTRLDRRSHRPVSGGGPFRISPVEAHHLAGIVSACASASKR